ncbi:MAG: 30S ribosomal protein S7 [Candidatus Dadabacteria bacterium]|nr:30S ribosomal protein S7 [Candidatus Dadabacteria bacterium]MCH8014983.1 30S ribosomal protein S7 [Candidatus Dadabacteria bacterium]TDI91714.1 MAG: 30S ribosomal protein S7 [Candidatus Dadabacteria bacterium]TDI98445.1 MAG: 30S ribosomal protein S7 [Candidatus Dadabacteria bacterium]
MPRKGSVKKRKIAGDPKYGNQTAAKFINSLMLDGKKSKAEAIFYEAFDVIAEKSGKDPLEVFLAAVENIKPGIEVRPRRVGGATYQVPMEVNSFRKQSLAIRWLLTAVRNREGKSMKEKLAAEILEASEGRGGSMKRKEDTHKMAEANRAFAHYRW